MDHQDGPGRMTFGQLIRQRRAELGLTQEELAERVGESVRQSEISRLERDYVALPRRSRLEALARALDVTPGYLLVRSGWLEDESELPGMSLAVAEAPVPEPVRPDPRPYEAILDMVESIPDEELEGSRPLQEAIARARETILQTGKLLRSSEELRAKAARRRRRSR